MKINKILLFIMFLSVGFFAIPGIIEALVCGCEYCGDTCVGSSVCENICCEGADWYWNCWWKEECHEECHEECDWDPPFDCWEECEDVCEDVWHCVRVWYCDGFFVWSHYGSCTDCGVSTCTPWNYYCSGDTVRRERDCVDRGCEGEY